MKEPWKQSPDVWPTKSSFFTWLRGALRKSIWQFYPPKMQFKNEGCSKPPEDYKGRAKSGAYCELTGEWTGKSLLEVDHKIGNVKFTEWEDVLPFILHLCCDKDEMALVNKEAHKIKSYAERMGISFEDAVIQKEIISICKTKKDIAWLKERGIVPASNAKKRRQQIEEKMKNEQNTSSK